MVVIIHHNNRRKFRSQTYGQMKSRAGQRQREEKSRREQIREEKESEERRCRCAKRIEKVRKSRNTAFFQWFVAPEGRKVGSLKRRVRSHLARWEMKKCTPLWREAHFEVKMYKATQLRSTFRSCDVEKVHAVVARSAFRSQNVYKAPHVRTTFGGSDVVTRGGRKGLCTLSKVSKTWGFLSHFQKPWQAWCTWRGSAKMHFLWQAQYKRHVHERC